MSDVKPRSILILMLSLLFAISAAAEGPKDDAIARARSAAPDAVSMNATIVDVDGTVLHEGTNGWTCFPRLMEGDDHPICNDAVWMKFMQALMKQEPFETDRIGISYMLMGDMNVNNADPFDTTQDEGETWVEEGPHLMVIVPDAAMLAGISDDPANGGPYVMWGGTPYAHIMVPVTSMNHGMAHHEGMDKMMHKGTKKD